ncbi:MAG: hypothetical protein IJS95_02180 [Prevotella sp.]|nr:hypothetical protein [Prevotella sp.]
MQKTAPSILSADGVLHLTCPRSWKEMSQEQLHYALHVIGCGMYSSVEGRTLMLLRFSGIEVKKKTPYGWACMVTVTKENGKQRKHQFFMQSWQVQDMIKQLEFVDSYEAFDVRLESIGGFKAVDGLLHGVRFHDYLNMEKYYQGYLSTKEQKYVLGMAQLLYPGGVTAIDDAEMTNCVMWFSYVKKQFASKYFRHFFRPAPVSEGKAVNWLEQMNAQIRALTDGDITKEQAVYDKDCWRALTELDAKAHDAEEFRKKYPNS